MRILAVDPGEKRLGIAISDPSGTIANPLTVLKHVSRPVDAASIAQLAEENQAGRIVVGQALDTENLPTLQSRRAAHLAEAIRTADRPTSGAVGRDRQHPGSPGSADRHGSLHAASAAVIWTTLRRPISCKHTWTRSRESDRTAEKSRVQPLLFNLVADNT